MLDDVVHGKVDEAKISLLIRLHQPLAKVINGRETPVIIVNRKVVAIENRIPVNETGHVQARKELGVNQTHLFAKEILEKVETPTTANVTTTLPTVDACL